MFGRILVLLVVLPLIELAILIWIGGEIGVWPTIALVLGMGILGALLARSQGMRVIRGLQTDLAAGRTPADRLLDGFLVLIGGILLLFPGLVSDVAGILLLIPFTRNRLKADIERRFRRMAARGEVRLIEIIR